MYVDEGSEMCETFDLWFVFSTEQLTELSDRISTLEVNGETSREHSTGKLAF